LPSQELTDVSPLKGLKKICLTDCTKLTDVAWLGNLCELALPNCSCLVDVTPLKNVRKLDLTNCDNVKDISLLSGVHKLVIDQCSQIRDITPLSHVKILSFEHVYPSEGQFLSADNTVREIRLCKRNLIRLQEFTNKNKKIILRFQDFYLRWDREYLDGYPILELQEIEVIERLTHLNAKKIKIINCPRLQHIGKLDHLEELYIERCGRCTRTNINFKSIPNLKILTLVDYDFHGEVLHLDSTTAALKEFRIIGFAYLPAITISILLTVLIIEDNHSKYKMEINLMQGGVIEIFQAIKCEYEIKNI
jgi:hypothetical protein